MWNRARDLYQGRANSARVGEKESDSLRSSMNFLFAITESAVSSLLPPNPQVTAVMREETEPAVMTGPEAWVNAQLDAASFRDEMRLAIVDCMFAGRAIYKSTWDFEKDQFRVRAVDPRLVHFDLMARRACDIRYWFEVCTMSREEFRRRVRQRKYRLPQGVEVDDITGGKLPLVLTETAENSYPLQYRDVKDYQPWVTVYEFYDVENERVTHWTPQCGDTPLVETDLTYVPYTLLTLNANGQDCRGLSEAQLVQSAAQDVNDSLTMWLNVVRRQIPSIGYDATALEEEQMMRWRTAGIGAMTPLKANGRPITDLFAQLPMPSLPPDMPGYMAKLESNIAYVSALADNARGQVSGAKTATELALIESQMQNRLRARQGNLDTATADVASKALLCGMRFQKKPASVKTPDGWSSVDKRALASVRLEWKVTPYSPLEQNRAVMEERWFRAVQYMQQRPEAWNWQVIDQQFVELFRLDPNVLQPLPPAPSPVEPVAPEMLAPQDPAALPPGEGEPTPEEAAAIIRAAAAQPPPPGEA